MDDPVFLIIFLAYSSCWPSSSFCVVKTTFFFLLSLLLIPHTFPKRFEKEYIHHQVFRVYINLSTVKNVTEAALCYSYKQHSKTQTQTIICEILSYVNKKVPRDTSLLKIKIETTSVSNMRYQVAPVFISPRDKTEDRKER